MPARTVAGDPVPDAVARYFRAIDDPAGGSAAADCFAPTARFSVPAPDGGRSELAGPEVQTMFRDRTPGPWHHVLEASATGAGWTCVHGHLEDGSPEPLSEFLVAVELTADGRIAAFEAFRQPFGAGLELPAACSPGELRQAIEREALRQISGATAVVISASAGTDTVRALRGSGRGVHGVQPFLAIATRQPSGAWRAVVVVDAPSPSQEASP